MKIPLMNINVQYERLKGSIDKKMVEIAGAGSFVLGKDTKNLEEAICRFCGVKFALGVASGTDALILALTALGVKEGDEVITTPFTFVATAEAISRVGARPVFVDIDPVTYNIDPAKVKEAVTSRTKAIIPVHLYGNPCDMDAITGIAHEHRLRVIEDSAQAIGAKYSTRNIGSMGDAGCLSFYPSKNLGAFGDGGMVITSDKGLADAVALLRVHGTTSKYRHSIIGFNSRLDNLQAAILSIKLDSLNGWTERRREIADRYNSLLKDVITVPREQEKGRHVYHLYVARVEGGRRDRLLNFLNENGVESRVYYPVPLHLQECYKELGYREGDLPEAESAAQETLALPLFPEMDEGQVNVVIDTVKKGVRSVS
ncbi:MAG: DegT/DnrJ/EryC1/StrS family aminotransferase [Candidatus Omnitrophica bacterium]|nr:DegT/DnrJ/EryC1/StrS family aminotransferase [Candidatus Omnitrophota bacterium]